MSGPGMPEPACVPLSDEDRAILDLECATVVGHVLHMAMLEGTPVTAGELRAHIATRLPAAPELRYRLDERDGVPVWVPDAELDLAHHVVDAPDGPYDEGALRALVAHRFAQHLDRTRPLWSLDVAPLAGGGTALLWRVHHALADGATMTRLSHTVLYDEEPAGPATGTAASPPATVRADHERRRAHLMGVIEREFTVGPAHSPFDGELSTRRDVAFVDTDLAALHAAARSAGATVNDAFLAVLAGGLRRWVDHHAGTVTDLRVRVPVSLPRDDPSQANRDSAFDLPLPVHVVDPLERLRVVHELTTARKDARDAARLDDLLHRLAEVSPPLRRVCDRLRATARAFTVSVSNVPGPRTPVAVLDRRVRATWPLAEIGFHHALRVTAASMVDVLSFGITVDPGLVPDVDVLADGLRAEAELLVTAAQTSPASRAATSR
ncbi:wax ester/triacylglycerol synthase domain-containing protein [Actinomycetospora straminea]|uniref:diacylglycerol O-acyltransferase n=1 Tax=Actinomycetospora straminea TaxID=663607 RepID=A0ABP9F629_9PSEU|nr:wax ester/triacylglycerol synthase domain-containing protein [Actinomycetospora straminea]MDD7931657.1 wax ester/triacylglycerol synthase family O-acyltransferase [Actinomycetospora straminea]